MTERSKFDLCMAGHPIPYDACPRCGATSDEQCRLADELSPKEKRENVQAYLAGGTPPHTAQDRGERNMEVRFVNGATVSRVYEDAGTEIVAAFQYEMHAVMFAELMAREDGRSLSSYYAVTNHHDGKLTIVKRPVEKPKAT